MQLPIYPESKVPFGPSSSLPSACKIQARQEPRPSDFANEAALQQGSCH